MTERAAPGVIAGCLGLVLAVLSMTTETPWLAGAAGVCALVAGLFTLGLADRLTRFRGEVDAARDRAERAEADSEVMAARAAVFEARARKVGTPAPVAAVESAEIAGAAGVAGTGADAGAVTGVARLTDGETGLFDATFFTVTLDKRVAAARRGLRPLALAVLEPVTGIDGDRPAPAVDRDVAEWVLETLRDSDIACRVTDERVAVILEDTPENGAVWTIERVRRRLAESGRGVSLRAGVACYPAHAFDADRLRRAADDALCSARDWPRDRIEVAPLPDDLD